MLSQARPATTGGNGLSHHPMQHPATRPAALGLAGPQHTAAPAHLVQAVAPAAAGHGAARELIHNDDLHKGRRPEEMGAYVERGPACKAHRSCSTATILGSGKPVPTHGPQPEAQSSHPHPIPRTSLARTM